MSSTKIVENELLKAINRILYRDWDPIGICDTPGSEDEYARYVYEIYSLLKEGKCEDEIFDYLCSTEAIYIGLPADNLRNRMVSKKVCNLFGSFSK